MDLKTYECPTKHCYVNSRKTIEIIWNLNKMRSNTSEKKLHSNGISRAGGEHESVDQHNPRK